jgi:hypothetical protein
MSFKGMISTIKKYEVQVDEKPMGVVLRVNDQNRCILRICRIPRELVFDEQGNVREFIDITYPKIMK